VEKLDELNAGSPTPVARSHFMMAGVCGPDNCVYNRDSLKQHIKWCIFHEGCRSYSGNTAKSPTEVRDCCYGFQGHNDEAICQMNKATAEDLASVVAESTREIPGEFQVWVNFRWVCEHEGQGGRIRALAAQGDLEGVRAVYSQYQNHNPNARNLLNSCSDDQVKSLVKDHCP
jgi:hypothetical protein